FDGIATEQKPYTLSMAVRAEGTSGLRLQLYDAGTNGVVADYDLERMTVSTARLGQADNIDAEITDIGGDWRRGTLTTGLLQNKARVTLQLRGPQGTIAFPPAGQAVRFRSLRLERGQSASVDGS